jgi:hypothetical protein
MLATTTFHDEVAKLCDTGISVALVGPAGTGKVEFFKQWCTQHGKTSLVFNASGETSLVHIQQEHAKIDPSAVLIVDEVDRCDSDVLESIWKFASSGTQVFLTLAGFNFATKPPADVPGKLVTYTLPPNANVYCTLAAITSQIGDAAGSTLCMAQVFAQKLCPAEYLNQMDFGFRTSKRVCDSVGGDGSKVMSALFHRHASACPDLHFRAALARVLGVKEHAKSPSDYTKSALEAPHVGIALVGSATTVDDKIAFLTRTVTPGTAVVNIPITNARQLVGDFNEATNEWKDGDFTTAVRKHVKETTNAVLVLVTDHGDPIWMEALNTVLDQNKTLSLASGENIPITPNVKVCFVMKDCSNCSPAVVSRLSVVAV